MSIARIVPNTSQIYPCIQCGGENSNIVLENNDPAIKKLKCNVCSMVFTAADSITLQQKGQIPSGPPVLEQHPNEEDLQKRENLTKRMGSDEIRRELRYESTVSIPRTLKYLLVSKNRSKHDFCNQKNLNKTIMKWEAADTPYELYQLTPKKVNAKVVIE